MLFVPPSMPVMVPEAEADHYEQIGSTCPITNANCSDHTLDVGIFVTTVNDPPVIKSPDSIIVDESEYYIYRAFAEDPEDSTLQWTFYNLPSWMGAAGDSAFATTIAGSSDQLTISIFSP